MLGGRGCWTFTHGGRGLPDLHGIIEHGLVLHIGVGPIHLAVHGLVDTVLENGDVPG